MAFASVAPAAAQDAARIEAIERQIRGLQQELKQLRREAAQRDAEARAARQEAERARAEAQAALRRLETAPSAVPAAPPGTVATAATPPGSDVRVSFPNGRPTVGTADGRSQASLGALFQFDVGSWIDGPSTSGENLRRGRLYFGFRYDHLLLNITPDFGGSPDGDPTLYEASLNWTPVQPLTLTLGYFKPWITLQNSTSAGDLLFLERPSVVNIARGVAGGIQRASLGGRWAADRWFASAYLTGDTFGAASDSTSVRSQIGSVLRLAGRPVASDDRDLHLGFSGSYVFEVLRRDSDQTVRLRDWPEVRLDSRQLIDTGDLPADKAWTWGPEFGLRWRDLLLQGEFIEIGVDQAGGGPDLTFPGGYVEGSWVMTGEPRRYSASAGAFTRPHPREPVSLRSGGGWGAWELATRYSIVDLDDKADDGGASGGRQEVIGLALSWYPTDLLRFTLQGDHVDVDREDAAGTTEGGEHFWTVALRTQVAF